MIASVGLWVLDTTLRMHHLPEGGESIAISTVEVSEGGKAANQIVAAARLGASTALLGTVGTETDWVDPLHTLRSAGVDVRYLRKIDDQRNGFSIILLADSGEQTIATYSGPGESIDVEQTLAELEDLGATTLLLQGETDVETTIALAKAFLGRVIFDPSPVPSFVNRDLSFADILTPNWNEAKELTKLGSPTATDVREATGAKCVILTSGSKGVDVANEFGSFKVSASEVRVVDPSGAGDAFNGALATALDQGHDLESAVHFANKVATWSVQRMHCIPSYPMLHEISDLIPASQQGVLPAIKENSS